MLHVTSERFLVLTAVDGLQRDRSDGSMKLENQKGWLPAITCPRRTPMTRTTENATKSFISVAVDTKMVVSVHVELPIEAAVRPMPSNGGVGKEGVFYEHASTDQSPRREKSGR